MNEKLKQGKTALKLGDRTAARKLFNQVVRENPDSETAWQWLYNVADSDAERRHCLEKILSINPNNAKARQLMGNLAPSEAAPTTVTCPYCKSQIHPEAIICPHCRKDPRPSMVVADNLQKAGCALMQLPFLITGLILTSLALWCIISVMLGQ